MDYDKTKACLRSPEFQNSKMTYVHYSKKSDDE